MNKRLYGYAGLAGVSLLGLSLLVQGSKVDRPVGKWVAFGELASARSGACTATLPDGSAIVIGGEDENGPLATAEALSLTGTARFAAMKFARTHLACVAMSDGRILVAGGSNAPNGALNSAEIFDPASGTWTDAGPMAIARVDATASAIMVAGRQRILIAGGENTDGATRTIEIYDPDSNSFSMATASMTSPRRHHASATLPDGRVVLVGGSNGDTALDTVDIFDPASGTVSALAKMSSARKDLTATTLLDGRVLLAGGSDGNADLATADILDPATASIATVAMTAAHSSHRAFLLPDNNTVVLIGGEAADAVSPAVEKFVPWKNQFQPLESLSTARRGSSGAAPKGKGILVVAGGTSTAAKATRSTESMRYATIATDQPEYWAGQTVTLNGDGWQPGETVAITMKHTGREDGKYEVLVDADGKFSAPVGDITAADIGNDSTIIVSGSISEAAIKFHGIATPAGAFVGSTFAGGRNAPGGGAAITTDQHLYHPGDTMIITGTGFNANNAITLTIARPDKVVDSVPGVVSDLSGAFTAQYIIQGVNGALKITATDGINTATTNAVDPPAVTPNITDYSQCSNDLGDGYSSGDTQCRWINGNLNPNNSGYHEGDSTVQRAFLTDVTGGTDVHTITFQYDTTKNGSHAYDFLTDPRFSETFATDVCDGASANGFALCSSTAETSSALIPTDANAAGFDVAQSARHFMIRNGTITNVELLGIVAGDYTSTSDTAMRVSFTVNTGTCNNATTKQGITTCPVLITFGAHVSKLSNWGPIGGTTASNISGSPYHVALVNIDGASIGQRDNQMSTNLVGGSLTIVKRVVNDNGGTKTVSAFGITTSAGNLTFGAGVADGNNTLKYTSNTLTNLSAGTKTLIENATAGYTPGTWSCVGQTGAVVSTATAGSVDIAAGEDVTCTITNDDSPASLTIVKNIVNDNGGTKVVGDFGITTTAGSLVFGAGVVNGSTTTYTSTTLTGLSAGSKTLHESDVAGYTEGSWSCTGNAGAVNSNFNTGSVVLGNGESVTCTITNNDDAATLTIVKNVVNDNGGTKVVGDFGITTTAGSLVFGAGVVNGSTTTYTSTTLTGLSAGSKTLHENDVAGYAEGSWSCTGNAGAVNSNFNTGSVVLANGEAVTCTITNNDDGASLTIVKNVVNDNGGTKTVSDFGITTTAGSLVFGAGVVNGSTTTYTSTTLTGLSAGSKTLHESDVAGYSEGTWSCVGNAGAVNNNFDTGSVVLGNGESVTCTITNDDSPASLTIVKNIVNDNGGTKVVGDFGITTTAGSLVFGAGVVNGSTTTYTSTTLTGLSAGSKTLHESDVAGYTEGSWSCVGNAGAVNSNFNTGSVVLANGESVTCTITNDDDAASLTIVKKVTNDNGGTKVVGDFGITTTAGSLVFGAGVVNGATTTYTATTLTGLSAGTKTLHESDVAGYTEGSWSCVGNAGAVNSNFNTGSVVLANGESVTCTIINNDDPASLTIVKNIVNDNGGTKVVGDFGITTTAGSLVFGAGVVNGSTTTYTSTTLTGLSAGSKTLHESDVTGYTEGSWSCVGNAGAVNSNFNTGSVVLANGESVTCTITNNDDPASLTIVKNVVNDNGGTKTVNDFGITTTAGSLTFGAGVVNGSTTTYTSTTLTGLAAGTKTLHENDVTGYTEGSWSCVGNAGAVNSNFNTGSVVLANGESVTCTITNNDQGPTLQVIKRVINDNGGGLGASAFGITAAGSSMTFGSGAADGPNTLKYTSNILTNLVAGTKVLHEDLVANYSEGTWSCTGNNSDPTVGTNAQTGSVVLGLNETVVCTITNNDIPPTMIVNKVVVPGSGADPGRFNLTIDGVIAGTGTNVGDGGTTGSVSVNAGSHTAGENVTGVSPATVLSDYVTTYSANCPGGVVNVPFGGSATCTITNTKKATVKLIKTLSGLPPTGASAFTFNIRTGASAANDGTVVANGSGIANAGNGGIVIFGAKLDPAGTYQFCETGIPVSWSTTLSSLTGAFIPPNGGVNDTVCVPFGAGTAFPLTAGGQLTFTVDNTPPPGGGTRTIGYWRNWSSCDGKGKQTPILDRNLPQTIGDLLLAGTNNDKAAGCGDAVDILSKSDLSGKKMASDPAYNMAAQLLAAKLNVQAGAGNCTQSALAIASGQALLDQINFNGTGTYADKMTPTQISVANTLAGILDAYNQDNSVCSLLPVPPSIVFTSAPSTSVATATGGTFNVTATANPGPAPTFKIESGAPAGVTIDSATGVMTIPAGLAPGSYPMKLSATSWGVVYQTFTLTITP